MSYIKSHSKPRYILSQLPGVLPADGLQPSPISGISLWKGTVLPRFMPPSDAWCCSAASTLIHVSSERSYEAQSFPLHSLKLWRQNLISVQFLHNPAFSTHGCCKLCYKFCVQNSISVSVSFRSYPMKKYSTNFYNKYFRLNFLTCSPYVYMFISMFTHSPTFAPLFKNCGILFI